MKIPDGLNFNFILRAYIPGLVFSIFSFPSFSFIIEAFRINKDAGVEYIVIMAFFWAVLVSILNYKLYQVFEGRIFWPEWYFEFRRKRWESYIKKLGQKIEKADKLYGPQSHQSRELWYKLRQFPLNDKTEYFSYYPTRLGNVIHEYVSYSEFRYGIDAVFFWYRMWLKLDEEIKKDLDNFEAKADMAVHSSFTFFVIGFLNLCAFIFLIIFQNHSVLINLTAMAGPSLPPSALFLFILSLISLFLGIGAYQLSISLHRSYGEFFKSVIDLNRDLIPEVFSNSFSDVVKEDPEQIRRFLQYHKIRCVNCSKINKAHLKKCVICETKLPVIFKSEIES